MLKYNKRYVKWLQEEIDKAGKWQLDNLKEQYQKILSIEEEFILPKGYEVNYPEYIKDISNLVLSGERFKILLTGKTRTGKTTLSQIIETNIYRLYINGFLRSSPFSSNVKTMYDKYRHSEVKDLTFPDKKFMFIDDIGSEKPKTDASKGYTEALLTHLCDDVTGSIVITTNLNYTEISENYGDRVANRLVEDFVIFKMNGKNFSMEMMDVRDVANPEKKQENQIDPAIMRKKLHDIGAKFKMEEVLKRKK